MSADILLIEDTSSLQLVYQSVLKAAGHRVTSCATAAQARVVFQRKPVMLVIIDLMLPDGDGIALMQELRDVSPGTPFIVITATRSISRAVEAMRAGAHDFLVKPFDEERFLIAVDNALRTRRAGRPTAPPRAIGGLIGASPAMTAVHTRILAVAGSDAPVYIVGESGTGKALCARTIHVHSRRAHAPFIAVNCAAGQHDQLEAALFGDGASQPSAFDRAAGGTLFLDEVCELDAAHQASLLNMMDRMGVAAGESGAATPDVRLICSCLHHPVVWLDNGQFREDLHYRLHVVPIHIPPLRERGADAALIASTMLPRIAREEGRTFTGIADEVAERLTGHGWPGNVRELLNMLRMAVVMNDGPVITAAMLPSEIAAPDETSTQVSTVRARDFAGLSLAAIERMAIEQALTAADGSITRAARTLGVAPSTIYRKLESWQRREG